MCVNDDESIFGGWKMRTVHTSCMNFTHDCICMIKISGKTNWCNRRAHHRNAFFTIFFFISLLFRFWFSSVRFFFEQMNVHWDHPKSIHFASNRIGYKIVIIFQFTQFFTWTNCQNKVSGKHYFILAQKCILCSNDDDFSYDEREREREKRFELKFAVLFVHELSCVVRFMLSRNFDVRKCESFESSPQLSASHGKF